MPIKLNRSGWPATIAKLFRARPDPRLLMNSDIDSGSFSEAVSVLKFGTTFKTTAKYRYPDTIDAISRLKIEGHPTILDIGTSDGVTALDLIDRISCGKYFATDLNTEVRCQTIGGSTYFYDHNNDCMLIASDRLLVYAELDDAWVPLGAIAKSLLAKSPAVTPESAVIPLVNPGLAQRAGPIEFCRYDMFTPWQGDKADITIAANILNRAYFSDEQILSALANMIEATKSNGFLVLVDNRAKEQSSVVRLGHDQLEIVQEIGGGTEIRNLILSFASPRS